MPLILYQNLNNINVVYIAHTLKMTIIALPRANMPHLYSNLLILFSIQLYAFPYANDHILSMNTPCCKYITLTLYTRLSTLRDGNIECEG